LDACPCTTEEIELFSKAVNKGFANVLWNNSCKACFSPLALSDCETVEWKVNGIFVGTSIRDQSFCYNFPNSGTYNVEMVVSRATSNGSLCMTFSKSQSVKITCGIQMDCNNTIINNSQFTQEASVGPLNSFGNSEGWTAPFGSPLVLVNQVEMTTDSAAIFLTGNNDSSDVLSRDSTDCWPQDSGMITLRTKERWFIFTTLPYILTPPPSPIIVEDPQINPCLGAPQPCPPNIAAPHKPGQTLHLNLFRGNLSEIDLNECDPSNCFELGAIRLPIADSAGVWRDIQIPYDLRIWDPSGKGGCIPDPFPNAPGLPLHTVVYINNWLGDNQGDSRSIMILDNICFNSTIVATNDPVQKLGVQIFPNPTNGALTIEFADPIYKAMQIRIINTTGQIILEKEGEIGSNRQSIETDFLPPGLYFIQLFSEGQLYVAQKFVKQ